MSPVTCGLTGAGLLATRPLPAVLLLAGWALGAEQQPARWVLGGVWSSELQMDQTGQQGAWAVP